MLSYTDKEFEQYMMLRKSPVKEGAYIIKHVFDEIQIFRVTDIRVCNKQIFAKCYDIEKAVFVENRNQYQPWFEMDIAIIDKSYADSKIYYEHKLENSVRSEYPEYFI